MLVLTAHVRTVEIVQEGWHKFRCGMSERRNAAGNFGPSGKPCGARGCESGRGNDRELKKSGRSQSQTAGLR